MATLKFSNLNKIYPNNVQAVFDFNLDIKDKEFIVFVGPSGCGKSTTLRMVAGLEDITSGSLYIDDRLVNSVEPKDRGIAMVFQNYALYPHMTVFKNMAFSLNIRRFPVEVLDKEGNPIPCVDKKEIKRLTESIKDAKFNLKYNPEKAEEVEAYVAECETKIEDLKANPSAHKCVYKHLPKEEVTQRVNAAAEILGLTEYLNRKPSALSGGQRQRVALGRAIVRAPKVFLMDEPLSNLDAKLRVQMRSELTKIHQDVGATTIYVTHDQTEAMTMADRIVVMKSGYIQQIATPKEIYDKPANVFVATFIGSPAMNILEGTCEDAKTIKVGDLKFSLSASFKKTYFDFYKKQAEEYGKTVELLNKEIEYLSKDSKRNIKAIDQRTKALESAQNCLDFANEISNNKSQKILVGMRPENLVIGDTSKSSSLSNKITVKIEHTELLGQEIIVYTKIDNQPFLLKVPSDVSVKAGDNLTIAFNLDKVSLFDFASTNRIA